MRFQDYYQICMHFNLTALMSRALLKLIDTSSTILMQQEMMSLQGIVDDKEEVQKVEKLLLTDLDVLLRSQKQIEGDLKCARYDLAKGEIIAKLIFEVFSNYLASLEQKAIQAFLYLLLWFRARGYLTYNLLCFCCYKSRALTPALAELHIPDLTLQSVFCKRCYHNARGELIA